LLARIADERGSTPKSLSDQALRTLQHHAWPGNVRELENALRAASLFAEGDELEVDDFTQNVESLRHLAQVDGLEGGSSFVVDSLPNQGSSAYGTRDAQLGNVGSSGVQKLTNGAASAALSPSQSSPTEVAYAHIRSGVSLGEMKRQIERECISRALGETDGNITRAATLLGMKRPRLSQLVKQYGLGGDAGTDDSISDSSEEDEG